MKNKLELEINKNDASFDTKDIKRTKYVISKTLANVLVGLMLFSGSTLGMPKEVVAETTPPVVVRQKEIEPSTVVDIPIAYRSDVTKLMNKSPNDQITVKDLNELESSYLILNIVDDSSLEWMNYLKHVKNITFLLENEDESKTSPLKDIKKIDGAEDISFWTYDSASITEEECTFLKNSKDCKKLSLLGVNVPDGVIEKLNHLKELSISNQNGLVTSNIDFSKLTFLDSIKFPFEGAYEAAINISTEDYNELTRAGVSIEFGDENQMSKFIETNKKIDNIVKNLGVSMDASDSEKLDAILIYVLENYEYSKPVSDLLESKRNLISEAQEDKKNNLSTDFSPEYQEAIDDIDRELARLTEDFYKDGRLYAAMEGNEIICGNYTALINALANRLGVNSTYLSSGEKGNHAWNLVELDGQYYYVDGTWLDSNDLTKEVKTTSKDEQGRVHLTISYEPILTSEAIKAGETKDLEWYREDPTNYPINQTDPYAHEAINIPDYIQIKPITPLEHEESSDDNKPIKITEESNFEVIIKDKRFIIGGAAAIGILSALGGAVIVNKKKKEERRRRLYNEQYYGSSDIYGEPYSYSEYTSENKYSRFGRL